MFNKTKPITYNIEYELGIDTDAPFNMEYRYILTIIAAPVVIRRLFGAKNTLSNIEGSTNKGTPKDKSNIIRK